MNNTSKAKYTQIEAAGNSAQHQSNPSSTEPQKAIIAAMIASSTIAAMMYSILCFIGVLLSASWADGSSVWSVVHAIAAAMAESNKVHKLSPVVTKSVSYAGYCFFHTALL